jgi:hypothetical protein
MTARILIFGSRSLTWKHLPVMRLVASHAALVTPPPLEEWLTASGVTRPVELLPGPLQLLNGDGPPGKERGAIGADKLAVLACMEAWPEGRRRMRWFPPEPVGNESWAEAAGRRNREMVEARPDRAYCIHTNLEASIGSSMTASLLIAAGIAYWHVWVSQAGGIVSVELVKP